MKHEQATKDRLARDAAQLLATGAATSISEALRLAIRARGGDEQGGSTRPSFRLVREHLRGMSMQSLGREGYEAGVRAMFEIAEEIMTVLEDCDPRLVGRAARGEIDGGATLYFRIFTRESIGSVASRLVEYGYEEPAFETADTKRFGRFDRIRFEESGWPVTLTRLSPERKDLVAVNLFSGDSIESLTLDAVRRRVEGGERASERDG